MVSVVYVRTLSFPSPRFLSLLRSMKWGRFTRERKREKPRAVYAREWAILSLPTLLTGSTGTLTKENRSIREVVITRRTTPAVLTLFFIDRVMNL